MSLKIRRRDEFYFVANEHGVRVSALCETARQAINWRDKLLEYQRDGIIKQPRKDEPKGE